MRAVGLSAARLIVALTRRPAAARAVRRGSVRIRPDTTRASEAAGMPTTPLMGEVDDVGGECRAAAGGEGRAAVRGERHRGGEARRAAERPADDALRTVVARGVPPLAEAVDADGRTRVRRI